MGDQRGSLRWPARLWARIMDLLITAHAHNADVYTDESAA
jgi:hypothetical protein